MLHTAGITDCSPAEVNYDASRIEVLQAHFQQLIDQKKIQAAAYCVSRYGKTFIHGAVGPLSFREHSTEPLLPTSVHSVASITKAVTTVAIAKLVEDGVLRFDMPVGAILKLFDVAPFNKIDIYGLLTHTSGMFPDCAESIPYHKSYWQLIDEYFNTYKPEDGEPDWLKASLSCGVNKLPGEEWQYCSFGFCILGEVIRKVTGITAEQYIEENILKPLGMKDSVFELTPELAKRHIIRNERYELIGKALLDGQPPEISPVEKLWDTIVPKTGGGLMSTPADLIRFANMLLGMGRLGETRILGRKTVEKITTRTLYGVPDHCWNADVKDRSYGIGLDMKQGPAFLYSPTTYLHEGAGACSMVIDPTEQLAAVWFVPFVDNNWRAEALFNVSNIIWSGII
ncbi:serine hydrolase domain-containing protein [Paenibacillus mesotrionivorans]|uniref:Serine hydrolase domain-containing protein n=1 Tax=Paenibacillus mesotrionivorans TaxID=3160968 RepID=A0ACC7P668_9BACL